MESNAVKESTGTISSIMYVSILLAVLLLAVVVTLGALLTVDVNTSGRTYSTANTTDEVHVMNGTIGFFTLSNATVSGYTSVCTNVIITNETDSVLIDSGNYTASSDCVISNLTDSFNLVGWSVNYTATWDVTDSTSTQSGITSIRTNITSMVSNFFALMPTVGTILAVVILIAAIVVLVMYVARMKDSGSSSSSGYTG